MRKTNDLIGMRFGNLTVEEKTEKRQERYCVWLCNCDCGGKIEVNTRRLVRGVVTNCGCIPKKRKTQRPKADHLKAEIFGEVTGMPQDENKSGKKRVKQKKDLAGQRFGRLTVLGEAEETGEKTKRLWHCRCDCGTEVDILEGGLISGNNKSCGCLKLETWEKIPDQLHRFDGTCIEWLKNRKYRSDNTSGFRGVYRNKNGTYRVMIGFKKKRFYLGTFEDYQKAVKARLDAEEKIHTRFIQAYYVRQKEKENGTDIPMVFDVNIKKRNIQIVTNILLDNEREIKS